DGIRDFHVTGVQTCALPILPEFVEEPEITRHFDREPVISYLDTSAFVKEYSSRIFANGMISSAQSSRGITIYGIDPAKENALTRSEERRVGKASSTSRR